MEKRLRRKLEDLGMYAAVLILARILAGLI